MNSPPKKRELLHQSWSRTVERAYDRAREAGIPKENAKKIAEESATITHNQAEKRK